MDSTEPILGRGFYRAHFGQWVLLRPIFGSEFWPGLFPYLVNDFHVFFLRSDFIFGFPFMLVKSRMNSEITFFRSRERKKRPNLLNHSLKPKERKLSSLET